MAVVISTFLLFYSDSFIRTRQSRQSTLGEIRRCADLDTCTAKAFLVYSLVLTTTQHPRKSTSLISLEQRQQTTRHASLSTLECLISFFFFSFCLWTHVLKHAIKTKSELTCHILRFPIPTNQTSRTTNKILTNKQ